MDKDHLQQKKESLSECYNCAEIQNKILCWGKKSDKMNLMIFDKKH